MNFQKLNNKTIKNLSIYSLGQAINIISPLLITPYLIATCGLEKFGVIAIGQSLAYILIVLVDYSSYIKGVKDISINRENNSKLEQICTTIYFSKLVLLLIVFLIILLLVFFIPYFWNEKLVVFLSATIIIGQFLNPTWFFQGVENFKWISLINILSKIIYVFGVLLFVNSQEDYVFVNFWLGFGVIVSSLMGLVSIYFSYYFNFFHISLYKVKKYLRLDFSFSISQLFFAVRNYSSVLIIGFVAGDLVAGQFRVIEQIINFFRTYLQMFFKFSYSYVCFEIDRSSQKGILLWKKYNGANLLLLFILLLVVFIFSEEILVFFKVKSNLLLMDKYLKTALLIPFLIGFTLPFEQLLFSLGKNKEYIKTTIGITLFNIIILTISVMFFGLFSAFLTLIFTEICLFIIYWILLKNYFKSDKII